jgi:hypothetical protein
MPVECSWRHVIVTCLKMICYLYPIKIDSSLATGANEPRGAKFARNAFDVRRASAGRKVAVPGRTEASRETPSTLDNPAAHSNRAPHQPGKTKESAGALGVPQRTDLDCRLQILF